jgi:hypothetical protein
MRLRVLLVAAAISCGRAGRRPNSLEMHRSSALQLAGGIRERKYSPWRKCSGAPLRCLSERGISMPNATLIAMAIRVGFMRSCLKTASTIQQSIYNIDPLL